MRLYRTTSTVAIMASLLLTGCLGGSGGAGTSSQTSTAEFVSSTVLDYDTQTAFLNLKGKLNVPGATDFNIVKFHSDSTCSSAPLGQGLEKDFAGSGIEIQIPSTTVTSIYVSTNTESRCFFLFEFLPRYDAPPAPALKATSPSSPSRTTTTPYLIGTTTLAAKSVRVYSDSACTLPVAAGTAADFKTTGIASTLTSNSITTLYATASDAFGKTSACGQIGAYEHNSTGASIPTYVSMNPVSPTNQSLTPKIIGAVGADAATVGIYSDAGCTASIGGGAAADFRTTGFQLSATANSSTSIYGQTVSTTGLTSDCSFLTIYVHDSLPPTAPVFVSVSPASPTNVTLYPRVKGTAPSDALTVKVFDDTLCVNLVGSGTKAVFEAAGIPATVKSNDATTLYAASVDAAGNISPCTMLLSYVNDTIAPDVPFFGGTVPPSPTNQSVTPYVQGSTDPTAVSIELFDDDQCAHLIGSGSADDYAGAGVRVTVIGNQTTTLYSRAIDEAQNTSPCSALANYAHSTQPAPNPGFYQSIPASPSRVANRPWIVGTATITISKVTIYRDNICAVSVGTASRSTFTTSGIQVNLSTNATSNLYAVSEDVYGNASSCTLLTSYTHDNVAPLDPTFDHGVPLSPNNSSTTPLIYGAITVKPGKILPISSVALFDSFLCLNRIGTGTLATGITSTVAPNSLTTIYARTFDDAGNFSNCVHFTDYVHDALIPGRPQLLSVTPGTPSYSAITKMFGRIGATTDFLSLTAINIYSDSNCTNVMTSGAPSTFTSSGIPVVFNRNVTTTVYATAVNVVGTASPCTALVNFVHRDAGPASITATQNLDGSVALGWASDTTANPTPSYAVRRAVTSGGPYTTIETEISGTSTVDFSISNGSTYYYVVAASNITGSSKNSPEVQITLNVVTPNAVAGLSALPGPQQATLNWSGFNTDMTFKVYRAQQSGGPYAAVATKLRSSTYIDTGLTNGTSYFYVVLGTNPKGDSLQSNEASVRPVTVPTAPTALTLQTLLSTPSCAGARGVLLTWSPSPYFNNFKVYRGTNAGASGLRATVGTNSYVDCTPGVDTLGNINYNFYAVAAGWGQLESPKSNVVGFANESAPLLKVKQGNGHILLSWTADPTSTGYQIQRATRSGGPYTIIAPNNAANTFTDSAVSNGQAYFYVVSSIYPLLGVLGWQSLEQSGIPGANPGAPLGLLLNVDSNKMPHLAWVPPYAYNAFNVYRSATTGGPYIFIGSAQTPEFTDASPDVGINFYVVKAVWGNYESPATNEAVFRNGMPFTISATAGAADITVAWSSVPDVLTYGVFRSVSKGGPYTLQGTTTALSYVDSSVVATDGYYYVVQANFADGTKGQFSSEVDAILSSTTVPAGLTIIDRTSSALTIAWATVKNAASYKIYKATNLGGPYNQVGTASTTSAIVTSLNPDTEYFIKVASFKSGTTSSQSVAISAYTLDAPSAPTVSAGLTSIDVSWGDLPGILTYDLKRSTDGDVFSTLATDLTSATYVDSAVSAGQLYFYIVVAKYPNGTLESLASPGVTPGVTPRIPQGLAATGNSTGSTIELAWGNVSGTTAYRVYSATTSGGPYTVALQTSSNSSNFVTGLTAGTIYYFVVSSLIGTVESAISSEISIIPMISPPAPIAAANGLTVELAWAAVAGASTYDVYRSVNGATYSLLASAGASTAYVDTTVSNATGYFYKYLPKDVSGISLAASLPSVSVTPGVSPTVPPALVISANSTTAATLNWVQVPNASAYALYRGTASGGPYLLASKISSPTTTFTDSLLTPGQTYFYVVRATNTSSVESADSNEVSITLVASPTAVVASAVANRIDLSWIPVGGATSYSVRRSQLSGGPYGAIQTALTGTSTSDSNVVNGTTYFYVVTASVGGHSSPDSVEASAVAVSAMNLQVPIELTDQGLGSDTAPVTFARTRTSLNTGDYDGTVSYEFEVVATNSDGSTRSIELVNSAGATASTLNIPSNTLVPTRFRVAAVPTVGPENYRIKTLATSASASVQIFSSRLLVNQINASRTKIYIPLMASAAGIYTGDSAAYIESTSNQSYFELGTASIFRRNSNQFSILPNENAWMLETVVAAGGSARGAVALFNATRGSFVAGTESTFEQTSPTLNQSPFSEGIPNFASANEGDLYQVVLRCDTSSDNDCDTGSTRLYKAGLWVTLTTLDKAAVTYRTSYALGASSETLPVTQRTLIDLSKFSNPSSYFQATANVTNMMDSATVDLVSLATADSGTSAPSAVPGSSLLFNSTAKTYQRSPSSVTLNSGDRYVPRITPGSDLFRFYEASVVIETHR